MFRIIASVVVIAGCVCAQASAVEIRADQPCIRRVCVEKEWIAYNDYRKERCVRWEDRLDAGCASAQPLPNGIKLAPPRQIQSSQARR